MSDEEREDARCEATFLDAADEPVRCTLLTGHSGKHYDRGFTWAPSSYRYKDRQMGPLRPCPRCGRPGCLTHCPDCHGTRR